MKATIAMTLSSLMVSTLAMAEIRLTTYNPQGSAIFPVTSTVLEGKDDVILFDAQFGIKEGQALVELIQQSNKPLKAIYITGGDPDFYFGLEPIVKAYPQAEIYATQSVVDHINKTKQKKIEYWGPILADNAPSQIYVPKIFAGDIQFDGETIELKEAGTHQAYYWLASQKTILGGVAVSAGSHIWMADSPTENDRKAWIQTMEAMIDLNPKRVIPGHYVGEEPKGIEALTFGRDYLRAYDGFVAQSKNSKELVEKITKTYPQFEADDGLFIGAKVSMGEMKW